jgi:hypothetical protein
MVDDKDTFALMGRKRRDMALARKSKKTANALGIDFSKRNYMVLGIGLLVIILGFIFLAMGDITISPILLVLGYCVIIPLGILLPKEKAEDDQIMSNKDNGARLGQSIQGS